jgi:hypothetical protein
VVLVPVVVAMMAMVAVMTVMRVPAMRRVVAMPFMVAMPCVRMVRGGPLRKGLVIRRGPFRLSEGRSRRHGHHHREPSSDEMTIHNVHPDSVAQSANYFGAESVAGAASSFLAFLWCLWLDFFGAAIVPLSEAGAAGAGAGV